MDQLLTTEDQAHEAVPVDGTATACPSAPSLDNLGSELNRRPGGRW